MLPLEVIVLVAVVVGVALLVVAAALAMRQAREPQSASDQRVARMTSLGMSIGMLFGAVLGFIVWMSTDEFVFWVIFMGGGMVTGLAAGRGWAERRS